MVWTLSCLLFLTIAVGISGEGDAADYFRNHVVQRRSVRKASSIGGSTILECEINYPPGDVVEYIITWRKQGIEVPIFIQFNRYPPHIDAGYQGRIRLVEQASIKLWDILLEDEGWYECSIVFLDGNEETNTNGTWIYLSVNSPPVLGEVSPSFLIQKEDDTVDLFCEATATPEPTLVWMKDGKSLKTSERVTVSGNRVQIQHLERDDGGMYTCSFKNIVGQVSHIIKLVIEDEGWKTSGNSYIMVPPKNTTIAEGKRVTLFCQAEGYPNNITYRWFKNDVDVMLVTGLMERAGVYADGSFVINAAKKEDSGWFKCRPSNGLGPAPEASAYLNITYLPRVLNMPERLYLPRGMLGRIECEVEANPPISRVTWTKDDMTLDVVHSTRLKINKQGSLVIKAVVLADEGQYTCNPFSAIGAGHPSSPVDVKVKDPPYFVVRPKPMYQKQAMQSVTMPCRAVGDPPAAVKWRKADGTFPSTTKTLQDNGNLTIINLSEEDKGVFECVATNVVTSVITTTLLIIEENTHGPYNLTVETRQYSAKASWMPAYDGGLPQHYVLWYRISGADLNTQWHTLWVMNEEATSVTVCNLSPDTQYEFLVLAHNRLGDSRVSPIVKAKTKGIDSSSDSSAADNTPPPSVYDKEYEKEKEKGRSTTPKPGPRPDPPTNITISKQRNGLVIRWLPPKNNSVHVAYYEIQYMTVGTWVPLDTVSDTTLYTWATFSHGVKYHFRVFSRSADSISIPSQVKTFTASDPRGSVRISDGMIGGIVGGLLFLFVTIILAVLAVKIFNKRRQRERALRYGNVKYFGPKQVDCNKKLPGSHDGRNGTHSNYGEPHFASTPGQLSEKGERNAYIMHMDPYDMAEAVL